MSIKTTKLGCPKIVRKRELNKSLENYSSGKNTFPDLLETAQNIRKENWQLQKSLNIYIIPSNDFSLYD